FVTAQLVWSEAGELAWLAAVFSRAVHPADSRSLPADLLLLSRGVLQSVLGRSTVVHGRRAAIELPGREFISAPSAELPSLRAVSLARSPADSVRGRLEGAVVHGSSDGNRLVRCRRRHTRSRHQLRSLERLSARMSFVASRRRRLRRS